jgi:hypothetical protein
VNFLLLLSIKMITNGSDDSVSRVPSTRWRATFAFTDSLKPRDIILTDEALIGSRNMQNIA